MKNGIIIGISIIIAGVVIAKKLPRYQYIENTTRVMDKNGLQIEETDACVFDMVSGDSYSKHITVTSDENGKFLCASHSTLHDPKHTKLETWKKQYEVFGKKVLTGDEWGEWKRNNNW